MRAGFPDTMDFHHRLTTEAAITSYVMYSLFKMVVLSITVLLMEGKPEKPT